MKRRPTLLLPAIAMMVTLSCMRTASAQYGTDHAVDSWSAPAFEQIGGLRTFDVEGDGDLDIFLCRFNQSIQGNLSWYENLGQGVFATPVTLHEAQGFPNVARDFDLADRDGDGDLDLVYVTELSSDVLVRTFEAGAFGEPEVWSTEGGLGFVRWMQLDPWNNALPDVVIHTMSAHPIGCYNTGGAFGPSFPIMDGSQAGLGPDRIEIGRFTGDDGDIIVQAGSLLHRYTQVDDGNGGHVWTMTVIGYCNSIFQVLDVDGDGDDDIGLAHTDSTGWLRSPGLYDELQYELLPPASAAGTFGRVDCDAHTDLLSLFFTDFLEPYISTGNATPSIGEPVAATGLPNTGRYPPVISDMDGDGLNDLLMVVNDTTLHWYANSGPAPGSVTLPPLDTLCENSSGYVLPAAEPPGGTWSGPGVENGIFSADGLGTGDLPVYYEALDSNQCPVVGATAVPVIAFPSMSTVPDTWGPCSFIPLQFVGSPAGGEWIGLADSTGLVQLTPGLSGGVQYTYIDITGGSCTTLGAAVIDMSYPSEANIGYDGPYCLSADAYQVIPVIVGNPGSLTIQGWVDSVNYITPGVADIYYLPDTVGLDTLIIHSSTPEYCPGVDTLIIEVLAPVEVTLAPFTDTLANSCASSYVLTGGLPEGGTYSGEGVTDGSFSPAGLIGDVEITYTYGDGECTSSATRTIHVIEGISVNPNNVDQCVSETPIPIITVPIPEVWFDPIISPEGILNAAQPFTGIVYCAWTDVTGCQLYGSLVVDLRAYSEGYVTTTGADPLPEQLCLITEPFEITRSLEDGTEETILFDPQVEGIGDFEFIGYAFDDGSGCLRNDTLAFAVVTAPTVSLAPFDTLLNTCEGIGYPLTQGLPAGGTYSGDGVLNDSLFAFGLTGPVTITYTYEVQEGCMGSASGVVELITGVNTAPWSVQDPFTNCADGSLQQLTAEPVGGSWSGDLISADGIVDTGAPATGVATYTHTDAAGCAASSDVGIVISLPAVELQIPQDSVLTNDAAFLLTGGSPSGGLYSGNTVDGDGYFHPGTAGVGWHVITYTYSDSTGCTATATDSIHVELFTAIGAGRAGATALRVWPVPASEDLYISIPMGSGDLLLQLVDAGGREVARRFVPSAAAGSTIHWGTGALAHGSYTLRTTGRGNIAPARIVIAH